jgi:hypothetical protein
MPINRTDLNEDTSLVEVLCHKYGVDEWHYRNSLRKPIYQQKTCNIVERIAATLSGVV